MICCAFASIHCQFDGGANNSGDVACPTRVCTVGCVSKGCSKSVVNRAGEVLDTSLQNLSVLLAGSSGAKKTFRSENPDALSDS